MTTKMDSEHEKAFLEIIKKNNLKITEQSDLNRLFDEFYDKYKTFGIFEKSKDKKFINAINRKKELENEKEKQKLIQHYILNINPQKDNQDPIEVIRNFYTFNYNSDTNKINKQNTIDDKIENDIIKLATKLESSRKIEMELLREQNKKWEQYKENYFLKYNSEKAEELEREKKEKAFFVRNSIKEASLPKETFQQFLNLIKEKKLNEYEKDPYIMDYHTNLNEVYDSSYTWKTDEDENVEQIDLNEYKLILDADKNITNTYKNIFQTLTDSKKQLKKNDKKNFNSNLFFDCTNENLEKTTTWKNFENDFNVVVKDQFTG